VTGLNARQLTMPAWGAAPRNGACKRKRYEELEEEMGALGIAPSHRAIVNAYAPTACHKTAICPCKPDRQLLQLSPHDAAAHASRTHTHTERHAPGRLPSPRLRYVITRVQSRPGRDTSNTRIQRLYPPTMCVPSKLNATLVAAVGSSTSS
jgi:hypothetical protein